MQLLITPQAEQDLEVIGDYIAQDNPVRASSFIVKLREQCCREFLDLSGSEAHELSAFMSSVGSREVGASNRRWHTWRTDQAACFSFCEMTFPFSS